MQLTSMEATVKLHPQVGAYHDKRQPVLEPNTRIARGGPSQLGAPSYDPVTSLVMVFPQTK